MTGIRVEIGSPDAGFAAPFDDLSRRAPVNVFFSPAALGAIQNFAKVHVLRAWDESASPPRLVGLWALGERRLMPFWPAFLAGPAYDYAFVSTPVVDPALADAVIAAFLAAIERDARLPKVIRLTHLDGDAYHAIEHALRARGNRMLTLATRERPFLEGASGLKRSGSTRKKLRQDWNRLSALGAAAIVNDRAPAAVRAAFEAFLTLEANSWKGAHGTALLSDAKDAAFARRFIGALADAGSASVALLKLDAAPIAAQVLLYCGPMAYTWKTAFDAAYGKYSPGVLLVDKVSEDLLAGGIATIESCSAEGSFLTHVWTGRRATIELIADVGAATSLNFALAVAAERTYARLKGWRARWRALNWPRLPKRSGLAAPG